METKTNTVWSFKFKSHWLCGFYLWQNKFINITFADWLNKKYLSTLVNTDSPPRWSVQQVGANACPSCDSYQGPFALGDNDTEFSCFRNGVVWLSMLLFTRDDKKKWPKTSLSSSVNGSLHGKIPPLPPEKEIVSSKLSVCWDRRLFRCTLCEQAFSCCYQLLSAHHTSDQISFWYHPVIISQARQAVIISNACASFWTIAE